MATDCVDGAPVRAGDQLAQQHAALRRVQAQSCAFALPQAAMVFGTDLCIQHNDIIAEMVVACANCVIITYVLDRIAKACFLLACRPTWTGIGLQCDANKSMTARMDWQILCMVLP